MYCRDDAHGRRAIAVSFLVNLLSVNRDAHHSRARRVDPDDRFSFLNRYLSVSDGNCPVLEFAPAAVDFLSERVVICADSVRATTRHSTASEQQRKHRQPDDDSMRHVNTSLLCCVAYPTRKRRPVMSGSLELKLFQLLSRFTIPVSIVFDRSGAEQLISVCDDSSAQRPLRGQSNQKTVC